MNTVFNYTVYPIEVVDFEIIDANTTSKNPPKNNISLLGVIGILVLLLLIVAKYDNNNDAAVLVLIGSIAICVYIGIRNFLKFGEAKDLNNIKPLTQKELAIIEAEFYSKNLNSILAKSEEVFTQILPFYELSAKKHMNTAKVDFSDNAFSPFWREIEETSKFLACYKQALNQLCLYSELYMCSLQNKKHDFPIPFPFATNISISKILLENYKSITRKAQTKKIFSFIWEQRRNTAIQIEGFRTLEHAINNMNTDISFALKELNNSISSDLSQIKYIQKEYLENFNTSQYYMNEMLNSINGKLYYIQWKRKPSGFFE